MSAIVEPEKTGVSDDLLEFVRAALKTFGPNCTLLLEAPSARGCFVFPPDPAWSPPKFQPVQTPAQTNQTHRRPR